VKRITRLAALSLACAALAACGAKEGRSDHPADADSGQAAPATVPTVNSPAAPDSTDGVSQRTGQPGVAGDTLGSKAPGGARPPQAVGTPRRP
jgi:hypothetical protein